MTHGYALKLTDAEVDRYRLMAAKARRDEIELWTEAGIGVGATVADLGCGPGAVAVELADTVGPQGRVVGVDQDADALATAEQLKDAKGLDNVVLRQGDVASTGITPGTIDTVVMRHVLAHNGARERQIVEHAGSLVRPGGAVLLVDVDLTAHRIHPADEDWTDLHQAYLRFNIGRGNDPSVGLRLAELLTAAGLGVRRYQGWYSIVPGAPGMRPPAWVARDALLAEGCASPADIDRWGAALDRLDARPDPTTFYFPMFAALGVRP